MDQQKPLADAVQGRLWQGAAAGVGKEAAPPGWAAGQQVSSSPLQHAALLAALLQMAVILLT